ncbi:MAG: DinB family protein [Phycisphaerae bacterium]|jgi:hypothetical protein|nr:DinB family protein [Phycisphaerae bacterium]MCZ2399469.1 DinB family protein [Phycisphaerae bacterium]NUQ48730.1 DinB family protein [Phycisphaerae bacterium]
MTLGHVLSAQLDGTRDWTLRLLADLEGDDWVFQPAPGLAHPLWICGHLAASQNVLIHQRCLGRSLLDASFTAHYPIGEPVKSSAEHGYPDARHIRQVMDEVHRETLEAVRGLSDALLAEPAWGKDGAPHPHYRDKLGAVSHCARHEAFHAGQLALIRRLRGKPFLR